MQLENFVVAFAFALALAAVVHLKDISGISTYRRHTQSLYFQMYTLRYHFTFFLFVWLFVYFIFAIAIDFSICLCSSHCYVNMNDSMVFYLVCLPFHHPVKLLECVCVLFCFVVFFFFFRNSSNAQGPRYFAFVNIFKVYFFSFSLLLFFFQAMRLRSMRNAQLKE